MNEHDERDSSNENVPLYKREIIKLGKPDNLIKESIDINVKESAVVDLNGYLRALDREPRHRQPRAVNQAQAQIDFNFIDPDTRNSAHKMQLRMSLLARPPK